MPPSLIFMLHWCHETRFLLSLLRLVVRQTTMEVIFECHLTFIG